ncbi:MAG: nodulation protein NfeD, partial [Nitrospinaceae bacterium]
EMDTPGGLDTSMRHIIKAIQASPVPVATYVSPSGSRAASAGTFIAMASHIAAMAPGTNIGAAHPVNLFGGSGQGDKSPTPMQEKVVNDAAAYIRSLAESRGRNAYWAEKSVTQSVSISALEAKKLGVIDLVAGDLDALLLAVDGREVTVGTKTKTLQTKDLPLVRTAMNQKQKILNVISDPNIAYILMMIGLVGLYLELSNPGLILPGILGGIGLILALYAMQTLPINYAGLLLILLAGILFIAEANTASFGLLATGGVVSLWLGSLMLIDSDDPAMQISNTVLIPTLVLAVLAALGTLYLANQMRHRRAISGAEGMIGAEGVVKDELGTDGQGGRVLVHGEVWEAVADEVIPAGEAVVVENVQGLCVRVRKVDHGAPAAQS